MLLPLLASMLYFGTFAGTRVSPELYLATKLFTLLWPLFCHLLFLRGACGLPALPRKKDNGLRLGLLTGLAMAALLYAVSLSPFGRDLLHEAAPAIRQKIASFGMDRHFFLYACLMSTLHAGLEEYYWRWFVFGSLARWRGSALIWHALAATAFASHHVVVLASYFSLGISLLFGLGVAGAGMVWSLLYRASGSLFGPFLSHILADAAIMAVAWRVLQG